MHGGIASVSSVPSSKASRKNNPKRSADNFVSKIENEVNDSYDG